MREPWLLEATGITRDFVVRGAAGMGARHRLRAVDGVDLRLRAGECVALVGESGSGKTTLARCLLRLIDPTAGSVRFRGEDFLALRGGALRRRRRHLQMVFQDPWSSLNPRMRIGDAIAEPIAVHSLVPPARRAERVEELLEQVGLPAAASRRFPHELSGGQRQRVGIARALATEPELLVADEPVSALDVSVQAQILNLLARLQADLGLSLLVIAHDLALVEHLADRVAVLYRGRVVEEAGRDDLFARPAHPYTRSLLDSVPGAEPGTMAAPPVTVGEDVAELPAEGGCAFLPRCPLGQDRCRAESPRLVPLSDGRRVACHFPEV